MATFIVNATLIANEIFNGGTTWELFPWNHLLMLTKDWTAGKCCFLSLWCVLVKNGTQVASLNSMRSTHHTS